MFSLLRRRIPVVLLLSLAAVAPSAAARDDAALHDVVLVGGQRAWAVGDFGVILHTADGGATWRGQRSGTDACLQSVFFLDQKRGFAAGGKGRPDGAGGYGVLLRTDDGGQRWEAVAEGAGGWLYDVWFEDARKGWLAGASTAAVPTGLQYAVNGPARFRPLPGEAAGPLYAAAFADFVKGVAGGAGGRIVTLRGVGVASFGQDVGFGGALRGAAFGSRSRLGLVGDDATVFLSRDGGRNWRAAALPVAPELRELMDLRSLHFADADNLWAVGRGGGYLLHSADGGATWAVRIVEGAGALHAVHFAGTKTGLAVGTLGRICRTQDGGRTWRVVRNAAAQVAVLVVSAGPSRAAWPVLAHLYGSAGWRCGLLQVSGPPEPALRWAAQRVGCAVVERCDEFPALPATGDATTKASVLAHWSGQLDRDARVVLRRRIVAAIRALRPAVVIVNDPDVASGPWAESAVVAEAAIEAVRLAADVEAFGELATIGLRPHVVQRVWAGSAENERFLPLGKTRGSAGAAVASDCRVALLGRHWPRLRETSYYAGLHALAAIGQLEATTRPPMTLHFRQVGKRAGATRLVAGLRLAGAYRVPHAPAEFVLPSAARDGLLSAQGAVAGARRMAQDRLAGSRMMAVARRAARDAPQSIAGADLFYQLAEWHRLRGETALATEAMREFLTVGKRHPHWARTALLQASRDGSAEHRHRLGMASTASAAERGQLLSWLEEVARRAPYLRDDPALRFAVAHQQRMLGRAEDARRFYAGWAKAYGRTEWGRRAGAESWLLTRPLDRPGPCPLRILTATRAQGVPRVDGRLDDPAYRGGRDAVLLTAEGNRPRKDEQSRVRVRYDDTHLYVAAALRLGPLDTAPPATAAAAQARDRLDPARPQFWLALDIDRDAATAYRFALDTAGGRLDAIDDDLSFAGRGSRGEPWHAAQQSDGATWTVEFAVPLAVLMPAPPQPGQVWGIQLVQRRVGPPDGAAELRAFAPHPQDPMPAHRFGLLVFGK